jgi:ABC-type transporter Mla subunit MlaD
MGIGGDPQDIRAIARRVRVWADEVDDDASSVRRAKDIDWKSTAASSFIEKIETRYEQTTAVADSMRDAASEIDHLADVLQDRQDTLSDLLEKAGKTLADAEEMLRNGVTDLIGGVESLANEAKERAEDLVDGGKKILGNLL